MASTTTRNPATTQNPATGKRQGPPRKPLATTVVGGMGTRTTTPTRPTRRAKANPLDGVGQATAARKAAPVSRAPKAAPKATPAKAAPASRQLPRDLVLTVTGHYAKAPAQDQQRVANYLKVVTTGIAACGCRWWPHGKGTLPRPSHVSWQPASTCQHPANHAAANKS